MSNFAQLCSACGAPLQGARCPRCRTERSEFGKLVTSGGGSQDGGGGAATSGLVLVERGVGGQAFGGGFTVPNVTAQAGDLLCCYIVAFSNGRDTLSLTPAATWGPNALADSGFVDGYLETRTILSYLSTGLVTNANAGTQTITVTDADPFLDSLAIYCWTINGASAYRASGDDVKDLTPFAGPISAPITVPTANSLLVMYSFQGDETLDGGAYTGDPKEIRSDYLATQVPGRASIATYQVGPAGVYRGVRALKTPPRLYFAHVMAFQ